MTGTPKLNAQQLEYYWIQAGGPAAVAPIAAAIALAESGGRSVKQQGQPYATTGWGPWQITPGDPSLLDVSTNARAAVAKYRAAGNSFTPWTTYNNGKYKYYLQHGSNLPAYILGGLLLGASGAGIALAGAGAEEATAVGAAEAGGAGGAATGAATGGGAGVNLASKLSAIKSGLGVAALISVLLDPKHWLRILMVVGGAVIIFLALVYMLKSQLAK